MTDIIYERTFTTETNNNKKSFDTKKFINIIKDNRALIHVIADGGEGKSVFIEKVLKQNLSGYAFYNQKNIFNFVVTDQVIIDGWDEIPMYIRRGIRDKIIKSNAKGILIIGRDDNQILSVYSACVYSMSTKIKGTDLPPRFYEWSKCIDFKTTINSKTKESRICEITKRYYESKNISKLLESFLSLLTYKMLKKGSIMIKEEDVDKDLQVFNRRNKPNLSKAEICAVASINDGWLYFDNRSLFFYFCTRFVKELALKSPEILIGLYHPIFKMEEYKELSLFLSYSGSDVIISLFDKALYGIFSPPLFAKALMSLEGVVDNARIFEYYIAYNEKNNWEKPVNGYLNDNFAKIIRKDNRFIREAKKEILFRRSSLMIPLLKINTNVEGIGRDEIWQYCLRTNGNVYYFINVMKAAQNKDVTNLSLMFIKKFSSTSNEKVIFEWMIRERRGDLALFVKRTGHYFKQEFDLIKSNSFVYDCIFEIPYEIRLLLIIPKVGSYDQEIKITSDSNYFLSIYEQKGFKELKQECLYLSTIYKNDSELEFEVLNSVTNILKYLNQEQVKELIEMKLAISFINPKEKQIKELVANIFNYNYRPPRGRFLKESISEKQIKDIKKNVDELKNEFIKWEGKKNDVRKLDLYMQLCSILNIKVDNQFIIDNFDWASHTLNQKSSSMASRSFIGWIDWTKDYDWYKIQIMMVDLWDGNEQKVNDHKHYLSKIFSEYFINDRWGHKNIDVFIERKNYINPIIRFLTDNRKVLDETRQNVLLDWWREYKPSESFNYSPQRAFLESIPEKYKAGIEIQELIDSMNIVSVSAIVQELLESISQIQTNSYKDGFRTVLPVEDLLVMPNIVFYFLVKLLSVIKLDIKRKTIKLFSLDNTFARRDMLATLLFEICRASRLDFKKIVSYKEKGSLHENYLTLLKHSEINNKYDGFINRYYNYLNSEMSPNDFKAIIVDRVIPLIDRLVTEWDYPREKELQKKLASTISKDMYDEYRIIVDFEFNPYTMDASSKSIDISFSFSDMCIFVEIKNYDDGRLGTSKIHEQLSSYNNDNLFTLHKILYIFRKTPFVRKIGFDTKKRIRNFYSAAKTNDFEVISHPLIREKIEGVIK